MLDFSKVFSLHIQKLKLCVKFDSFNDLYYLLYRHFQFKQALIDLDHRKHKLIYWDYL